MYDDAWSALTDLSAPTRQSVWAAVFIAVRLLRRIGVTNLAVAFVAVTVGRISGLLLFGAAAAALALAAVSLASWWRKVFFVEDDELVVMRGIVNLERVTIPLQRIQAVDIDQQFLHRPIGLVRARLETAGSAGTEFEFEALDQKVAETLRTVALAAGADLEEPGGGRPAETPEDKTGTVVLRRTTADLARVAASRNPIADVAFLVPLIFVVSEVAGAFGITTEDAVSLRDRFDVPIAAMVLGGIVLYVVVFGSVWFGSTLLRYHDLTLRLEGDRLRSTSGMLSRAERSSSLDRIQLLRHRQNPVQRRLGIHNLSLATAAGSAAGAESLVLPGTTTEELSTIQELLALKADSAIIRPISILAVQRWVTWIGVVPAVVVGAAAASLYQWWALAVLLWIGLVGLLARRAHRRWCWLITDQIMEVRHGLLTCRVTAVARYKTQAVSVRRTLFHRRNGLATVAVHTASGDVVVPHIDLDLAHAVRDSVLFDAETDARDWM